MNTNTNTNTNISINNKQFQVNTDEFTKVAHPEYTNLKILKGLRESERAISLLNEFKNISDINIENLFVLNPTHGGYIPIECASVFENVFLLNINKDLHQNNIKQNIDFYKKTNIFLDEQ